MHTQSTFEQSRIKHLDDQVRKIWALMILDVIVGLFLFLWVSVFWAFPMAVIWFGGFIWIVCLELKKQHERQRQQSEQG